MTETKLTVRLSRELLDNVKRYAAQNNTTLTRLIEVCFQRISARKPLENAPILNRLSGILPQDVNVEDYKNQLEEKYGG
jgi:Family of unknown function (DUF6364)